MSICHAEICLPSNFQHFQHLNIGYDENAFRIRFAVLLPSTKILSSYVLYPVFPHMYLILYKILNTNMNAYEQSVSKIIKIHLMFPDSNFAYLSHCSTVHTSHSTNGTHTKH